MSSSKQIYTNRSNGKQHGDVFTSPTIVRYMLDLVNYVASRDLRNVRIIEPSCGDGAFVSEIARRLIQSAQTYHFNAADAFKNNVRAYDIDANKIVQCRNSIKAIGIDDVEHSIMASDFLQTAIEPVDIVVGNPPYIRYENIPPEMLAYCKANFSTFHYRCDLYVPFYEKTLAALKQGGKHCFICSNRWLKNEYGKKLRKLVAAQYALNNIINVEQADAFQEEVLAYPAITLITKEKAGETFQYAECANIEHLNQTASSARQTPTDSDWTTAFTAEVNPKFQTIEQQGFKIGIGVATGADAVFVSSELPEKVEEELILPGINAKDLRGNRLNWNGEYLFNPYNQDGTLVDLSQYPKAKSYLESHRAQLSSRHIARRSPSKWYKTIDRITPSLVSQPKILLPDISGNTYIFVDDGVFYPLHNIYYITGRSALQLRLLAALLMSDFTREQLASVTNKMNGGFSRWQSQHLRKLRLPKINTLSADDVQHILLSYEKKEVASINSTLQKYL